MGGGCGVSAAGTSIWGRKFSAARHCWATSARVLGKVDKCWANSSNSGAKSANSGATSNNVGWTRPILKRYRPMLDELGQFGLELDLVSTGVWRSFSTPGQILKRRLVGSGGRPKCRAEPSVRGSDLVETWHCTGVARYGTGPAMAPHCYCTGAAPVVHWCFVGAARVLHECLYRTSAAQVAYKPSTSQAQIQHKYSTLAAHVHHKRSPSVVPQQCQCSTSVVLMQDERSFIKTPLQHQCGTERHYNTSTMQIESKCSTSALPAW